MRQPPSRRPSATPRVRGLPKKRNFPAGIGIANRLEKRVFVVAVRIIRAAIEPRRDHGAVKGDPAAPLPEIDLERGEIAEADDTFGIEQLRREIVVE